MQPAHLSGCGRLGIAPLLNEAFCDGFHSVEIFSSDNVAGCKIKRPPSKDFEWLISEEASNSTKKSTMIVQVLVSLRFDVDVFHTRSYPCRHVHLYISELQC